MKYLLLILLIVGCSNSEYLKLDPYKLSKNENHRYVDSTDTHYIRKSYIIVYKPTEYDGLRDRGCELTFKSGKTMDSHVSCKELIK